MNSNDTTSKANSTLQANSRIAYQAPQLRMYGDVRSLTEAGVGSQQEQAAMTSLMKFP